MDKIFQKVIDLLKSLLAMVLSMFPDSPFNWPNNSQVAAVMGYVNYFIPVGDFIKIGGAWLTAIGFYYIYMAVSRWIKVLE